MLSIGMAYADDNSFRDTLALFKNAGESAAFFNKSYAYAVFPTVGEGALGSGVRMATVECMSMENGWAPLR
jgi:hypothetical protein